MCNNLLNPIYFLRIRTVFLTGILILVGLRFTSGSERINRVYEQIHTLPVFNGLTPEGTGLSGSFAGVHNNLFMLAGGYNFSDLKSEEVRENFSDAVFFFELNSEGSLTLKSTSGHLPVGIAAGSSVQLPEGVLCIGGLTQAGISDKVYLVALINDEVRVTEYPSLPVPLMNTASAVIGSKVYLMGGESPDGTTNLFLSLDIVNINAGWQRLPGLPNAVSHAMAAAQMDGEEITIFLFGGQVKQPGMLTAESYSHVLRFRQSAGEWEELQNIRLPGTEELFLSDAAALPVGASHIVLAGGFESNDFSHDKQETDNPINLFYYQRDTGNFVYNSKILAYNTITDVWFNAGDMECNTCAKTPAVLWNNSIWIACVETSRGVSTSFIRELKFFVEPVFGWINYVVLGLYFAAMLLLGFFFMKKKGSTEDFFKAGGRIPWWAAGISIFATTLSAITFIAIPAKTYASDWRMFMFNMAIIIIAPFVIKYYLPFFRRLNLDTAYQYLEERFNRSVRWLASSLFVLFMISRIAVVLYLPSLALNVVTGFSIYNAVIIMGIVTIIYCTSGGIEAVIWGDVIQGFILVGGAFAAFVYMISGVDGGLKGLLEVTQVQSKFYTFDFRFDLTQPVFWVVFFGGLANSLISYTSDQSVVQRYMTTRDEKATGRSIWLNGILSVPVTVIFFLLGTGLFAYYSFNPENLSVITPNIDSVFPQFIVNQMPAGMSGLLIAAIFAAAMSTLSSNINSVAAVITSDFYKAATKVYDKKIEMLFARLSGIAAGVLGILTALVMATWNIASLWDQFNTFLGLLTGGLGAIFIMGIFFPAITGRAALAGVTGGLIILLAVKNFTDISFLLYGFTGIVASLIVGWIFSFLMSDKKSIEGYTWKTRHI